MLWKCYTQYASKFGRLSSGHRTGKGQFSFQSQRMKKPKNIALVSHTSKVMLKILQARLQQYWTVNFLMFKLVLEKAEEPEIKLPTPVGSYKKQESSRKTSTSALLTTPKPLTMWITTNCGKFFKRWEYQTIWLPPEKSVCRSRSKLELDMEQQTGSKLGHVKAIYCHPAYLTYMQSTSREIPGWMKHKLESRLPGEISITSDMQMTPPLWQKVKKSLLIKVKEVKKLA